MVPMAPSSTKIRFLNISLILLIIKNPDAISGLNTFLAPFFYVAAIGRKSRPAQINSKIESKPNLLSICYISWSAGLHYVFSLLDVDELKVSIQKVFFGLILDLSKIVAKFSTFRRLN